MTVTAGATDVFNQPPPLEGHNAFESNLPLVEAVDREGASWAVDQLRTLGVEAGDRHTLELGRLANENPPKLKTHDRFGNRIDEVEFHPAWHELMHHAEQRLGIKAGSTTPDGLISLHHAECQAACTEAPCLQVNYRYRYKVTEADFDALVDELASGRLAAEIPPHGTVATVRQRIPADRGVGAVAPQVVTGQPSWIPAAEAPT